MANDEQSVKRHLKCIRDAVFYRLGYTTLHARQLMQGDSTKILPLEIPPLHSQNSMSVVNQTWEEIVHGHRHNSQGRGKLQYLGRMCLIGYGLMGVHAGTNHIYGNNTQDSHSIVMN
jgi:hypothetical protein